MELTWLINSTPLSAKVPPELTGQKHQRKGQLPRFPARFDKNRTPNSASDARERRYSRNAPGKVCRTSIR